MNRKEVISLYKKNGKRLIPLKEKKSFIKNYKNIDFFSKNHEHFLFDETNNLGWLLGEGDVVIDVDVRNGGLSAYERLKIVSKLELQPTVRTATGGLHIYFKYIKKEEEAFLSHIKNYNEIEVLKEGKHVVIPSSRIDGIKEKYKFITDKVSFTNRIPEELLSNIVYKKSEKTKHSEFTAKEVSEYKKLVGELLEKEDAGCSYDRWLKIGMALHHLYSGDKEGLDIWDKWSKGDKKKYDKNEKLSRKWHTFDNGKKSKITVRYFFGQHNLIDDVDLDSEEQRNLKASLADDFVAIASQERYHSLKKNMSYTRAGLEMVGFNLMKYTKKTFADYLKQNGLLQVVDACAYNPTVKESFFYDNNGVKYLNTFDSSKLPVLVNEDEICDEARDYYIMIKKHIALLAGEKKEARLIFDWLAHQIQNTGVLLRWCPIIQSCQGAGKSFIKVLLQNLLGNTNVADISTTSVSSQFNPWAGRTAVGVFEELSIFGQNRYEIENKIKNCITNDTVCINIKGLSQYDTVNHTNYIALTNSKNALPISEDDRRYFIIHSPLDTKEKLKKEIESRFKMSPTEYYNKLFVGAGKYKSEIRSLLLKHDITDDFRNATEAPDTLAKRFVQNSNKQRTHGLVELEGLIADENFYFATDKYILVKPTFDYMDHEHILDFPSKLEAKNKSHIMTKAGYVIPKHRLNCNKRKYSYWIKGVTKQEDLDSLVKTMSYVLKVHYENNEGNFYKDGTVPVGIEKKKL